MHSAPPTPAEHHYMEAEQGLAQLALLGLDEPERLVERLVALGPRHARDRRGLRLEPGGSPAVTSATWTTRETPRRKGLGGASVCG